MEERKKVLYVDDEEINLLLFKMTFDEQAEIITAQSGEEALDILKREDIELVLSDVAMPVMNGLDFVRKAQIQNPAIRYGLLTGHLYNPEIEEALDAKLVVGCFKKPFSKPEISSFIQG